jgi:hypothetical protein
MGLLEQLRAVSEKIGLLEARSPSKSAAPVKIQTRSITLAELTTELRSEEIRALADLPAELSVDFERVFQAAGIKGAPGAWNAERLKQVLRTDAIKKLERKTAQIAVLNLLALDKVPVEDVVKDVIARDQALDAFEAFARRKLEDRRAARERQIEDLEEQRKRLIAENEGDAERWRQWLESKRAAERELAWAVGYLIDRPVVTIDET